MSGFLKFILLFFLIILGLRLLIRIFGPYLMRYFINRIQKKASQGFQDFQSDNNSFNEEESAIDYRPPNKRKSNKDVGEYIDFEEID